MTDHEYRQKLEDVAEGLSDRIEIRPQQRNATFPYHEALREEYGDGRLRAISGQDDSTSHDDLAAIQAAAVFGKPYFDIPDETGLTFEDVMNDMLYSEKSPEDAVAQYSDFIFEGGDWQVVNLVESTRENLDSDVKLENRRDDDFRDPIYDARRALMTVTGFDFANADSDYDQFLEQDALHDTDKAYEDMYDELLRTLHLDGYAYPEEFLDDVATIPYDIPF